ncbi:MAG: cytochrome c oxidase assembly protein [Methylococcus sp.]|nr:MAG: cytochrome c oxidase assembly protein [Methylococcus sp.]
MSPVPPRRSNTKVLAYIVLVVIAMFGFGFALVPLYDVFCEWTGLNGKVKTEAQAETMLRVDQSRWVSVEFVTTVNGSMPLEFRAGVNKIKVHPGEYQTVAFYGRNPTEKPLIGRAIPSIAPGWTTQFLKKSECFCFNEQRFEPHQEREMVVRFAIDPELPETVGDVSLSYTFFDISPP